MFRYFTIALMLAAVPSIALALSEVYSANFSTPTTSLQDTLATYQMSDTGVVDAQAVDGMLYVVPPRGRNDSLILGAFSGDLTISAKLTTWGDDPVNINVGLRVGDNNFIYHPGLTCCPDGAFRIDGPGGHGNVSMAAQGFITSTRSLSNPATMVLSIEANTGHATVRVVDGTNPAMVYTESFTVTNYVAGTTPIGLTTGSSLPQTITTGTGAWFDDVSVLSTQTPVTQLDSRDVPFLPAWALVALSASMLSVARRSGRRGGRR